MRRRTQATRKKILESATRLFLQKGYAAASLDAIASSSGITKRTIYGYFPSKRELFYSVVKFATGDPLQGLSNNEPVSNISDLQSQLVNLARVIDRSLADPDYVELLRVVITEVTRQPDLQSFLAQSVASRSLHAARAIFLKAQLGGVIMGEPEILAEQFVGGFTLRLILAGLLGPNPSGDRLMSEAALFAYVQSFTTRAGRPIGI